jgi:release factor glutamine methyltransferase
MQTVYEAVNKIVNALRDIYKQNEVNNFAFLLLNNLRGYSRADLYLNGAEKLTNNEILFLNNSIERLKQSEPIQYIVGECEFMNLTFKVNRNTLIPRPETEELVEWALSEIKDKKLTILDIGTGSGCIACAIKKYAPNSTVYAWDISDKALEIAQKNAELNNVKIEFKKVDVLNYQHKNEIFDLIISNPPYIPEKQKKFIKPNVLNYEPHSALFVPDNKPFLFYEKIMDFSLKSLKTKGKIFMEINEQFGDEIINLLKFKGFSDVILIKDISGRNRMVTGYVKN